MTLDFQWNKDDFAESQLLIFHGLPGKKKNIRVVLSLFIFGLLIGGTLLRRFAKVPPLHWRLLTAGLFAVAFVFIVRFIGNWLMRWWFRKQYHMLPALHLPMQIVTDEHGMVYANASYKRRASWTSIVKWRETKTSFLIYIKFSLFVLIPKRDMPPGQISIFRELLGSKVRNN